jgi:hypothetical protein
VVSILPAPLRSRQVRGPSTLLFVQQNCQAVNPLMCVGPQSILTGLVQSAQEYGASVMLSTLRYISQWVALFVLCGTAISALTRSVHGELTTGNQQFDANTTLYTALIQQVANATAVPVTSMHAVRTPIPLYSACTDVPLPISFVCAMPPGL